MLPTEIALRLTLGHGTSVRLPRHRGERPSDAGALRAGGRAGGPRRWRWLRFRPVPAAALTDAAAFLFAFALMADVKEFVYFQF